jgi:hypothetical protein
MVRNCGRVLIGKGKGQIPIDLYHGWQDVIDIEKLTAI